MNFYEQHREYVEEVLRTAPDGVRVEWSGDTLIVQAAPSSIHQLNLGSSSGSASATPRTATCSAATAR
ncbi:hypothetical protein ACIGXI_30395 [Kitasatospora aureofaciens]|uniref:hypothetical protein n=1 Tax=Kitasatospora aureofaciens TaxID=1894 RepID=UPI0037CBBD7F